MVTIGLLAEQTYTNALVHESSPYLRQHAHNPVNWYPWGPKAFEKAKKEHKFIFLSIGYSTCHWCHVMEEESFTDKKIAKLLNASFVSIKVDREQYPQIDKKYQYLYLAFYKKRGGWPLSVFMTPQGKVFYLGTYIPKEEGYGSKGLLQMLPRFAALREHPEALRKWTALYAEALKQRQGRKKLTAEIGKTLQKKVLSELEESFDKENGGFALHPKFPEASKIELLLTLWRLGGEPEAYRMAETTLNKMANGGIYDQIGGGFFRYTTDALWQSPHFEKMLYTNAELIPLYVEMYERTGNLLYRRIVSETIAQFNAHYMQHGLYFSASDADSNAEEGGYFIYGHDEVKKMLVKSGMDAKKVEAALGYLGIEEDGNIDGELSQPHIVGEKVPKLLGKVKQYLKKLRKMRTFPFVDTKIITAWNAMMVKALFTASRIDPSYLKDAQRSMAVLWQTMRKKNVLYHQVLYGRKPEQKALLEDYAFLCDALLEGYERTYDGQYLKRAEGVANEALGKFYKNGIWYMSDDAIGTVADFDDRYYTSALSVMLESLLKLATLSEEMHYLQVVKQTVREEGSILQQYPAKAPKLARLYLRLQKGDVIIHADKKLLLNVQKQINGMQYPFVLSKPEQSKVYLACRINSCFAHDKNITRLIKKIEKAVR